MRLNYWGTRISLLWRMPLLTDSFEGSSVATQGEEEEQEQEEEKEEGGNQRVVRLIALSAKVRGSCSVGSG